MRLEMGRIDHDRPVFGAFICQTDHDPSEETIASQTLQAAGQGLCRPLFHRRITPTQPIAII